jgi:cellobiose-specific phosphotransferase system component IIB
LVDSISVEEITLDQVEAEVGVVLIPDQVAEEVAALTEVLEMEEMPEAVINQVTITMTDLNTAMRFNLY